MNSEMNTKIVNRNIGWLSACIGFLGILSGAVIAITIPKIVDYSLALKILVIVLLTMICVIMMSLPYALVTEAEKWKSEAANTNPSP